MPNADLHRAIHARGGHFAIALLHARRPSGCRCCGEVAAPTASP
jgi:hypothetical protein